MSIEVKGINNEFDMENGGEPDPIVGTYTIPGLGIPGEVPGAAKPAAQTAPASAPQISAQPVPQAAPQMDMQPAPQPAPAPQAAPQTTAQQSPQAAPQTTAQPAPQASPQMSAHPAPRAATQMTAQPVPQAAPQNSYVPQGQPAYAPQNQKGKSKLPMILAIAGGGLLILLAAIFGIRAIVSGVSASKIEGEGTALSDMLEQARYNREHTTGETTDEKPDRNTNENGGNFFSLFGAGYAAPAADVPAAEESTEEEYPEEEYDGEEE
ncbi:MAG: hypothetical protein K6F53_02995 [Lachnospiraceae bacterium]|nr:hypothetical protein [Lachnospiraceae bacterium]